MSMKQIAVIPNEIKDKDLKSTRRVVKLIQESGITALLSDEYKQSGIDATFVSKEQLGMAQMIVVLGGDGTLLATAREYFQYDIPILGINHGHLGFLTEIEKDEEKRLKEILSGKYSIAKHMTLSVKTGDGTVYNALNDATIHRSGVSRMLAFSVYVGDERVNSFLADGLIISTSTGSTAYSLSAGGPIVDPTLEVLIVTPICPHDLYTRSIILPAQKDIRIFVDNADEREAMLTLDGQVGCKLRTGEALIISGSKKIDLVRTIDSSFYRKLRKKLFEKGR